MTANTSEIEIHSDLDPKVVNKIAMYIFGLWIDFALGKLALGGRKIIYPDRTGYAASIQHTGREGNAIVGIYADESIAPEAGILEKGHGPFDLKTRLGPGHYPMHGFRFGGGVTPVRRIGASGRPTLTKRFMWARMRENVSSGVRVDRGELATGSVDHSRDARLCAGGKSVEDDGRHAAQGFRLMSNPTVNLAVIPTGGAALLTMPDYTDPDSANFSATSMQNSIVHRHGTRRERQNIRWRTYWQNFLDVGDLLPGPLESGLNPTRPGS